MFVRSSIDLLVCSLISVALVGCAGIGSSSDDPPSLRRGAKNVYVVPSDANGTSLYIIDPTQGRPGKMLYVYVSSTNRYLSVFVPIYRINKVNRDGTVEIDNNKKYDWAGDEFFYCDYTSDYVTRKNDLKGCANPDRYVVAVEISHYKTNPFFGHEPSNSTNPRCYAGDLARLSGQREMRSLYILRSPNEFSVDDSKFESIVSNGRRNTNRSLEACIQATKASEAESRASNKLSEEKRHRKLLAQVTKLRPGKRIICHAGSSEGLMEEATRKSLGQEERLTLNCPTLSEHSFYSGIKEVVDLGFKLVGKKARSGQIEIDGRPLEYTAYDLVFERIENRKTK